MKKIYNKIVVIVMAILVFGISLACIIKPVDSYSMSERRKLASFPKLSLSTIKKGEFMRDFEDYALDQFIFRDKFRALKSFEELFIFNKEDVNKLYIKDDYINKLEYPTSYKDLDYALAKFQTIKNQYLNDNNQIYLSIVPDKNYFMATDRLSIDYDSFIKHVIEHNQLGEYIDIFDTLELSDYYHTDTHWAQEKIVDTVDVIAKAMGVEIIKDYDKVLADDNFKGVYYGQLALNLDTDKLYYLDHESFKDIKVIKNNGIKEEEIPLYDLSKVGGKDSYEMFTGGNSSIVTITNPNSTSERKLIIFRDSFTSSLAPILATGYSEITLVDIRYIQVDLLKNYVDFEDKDILFLYSTLVLNNSAALK